MTGIRSLQAQKMPLLMAIGCVYLPFAVLLTATVVVGALKGVPLGHFMRDATAISGAPFYFGALSMIGVLFWCATASICFLTVGVLRRRRGSATEQGFFLIAGLLTSVLMVDDAFRVHEEFAPEYLGIPGEVLYLAYVVFTIAFLFRYRRLVLRSDYLLLVLCLAFLGASLAVDVLVDFGLGAAVGIDSMDFWYFLEDGAKLFGIAGWFSYFGWSSYSSLARSEGTAK